MDPSKTLPDIDDYAASGFFVLRTPLLPIEDFLALALATRADIRAYLRRWAARPEVQEALWLASPELLASLPAWWSDPESAKGRKLEQALYRYLARMTARATPFGAFAGCSVGQIADHTSLELAPQAQYRRRTRLDMEYLCNLAETISADPGLRGSIRFRCNTSLHLSCGRYHHLRGDWKDGARLYRLVATEPTAALDATLLRAAVSSGVAAQTLASALVESDPEIAPAEAEAFVARLIESQLLVSQLIPPVTGEEPVEHMIRQLEGTESAAIAAGLRSLANDLCRLDGRGLGAGLAEYEKIAGAAAGLGGKFAPGHLVQLDLVKPMARACLDQRLVNDVLRAIEILRRQASPQQSVFDSFKRDFQQRYGDREVPLLEALDDEAGIGFENEDNPAAEPLIAGIDFRPSETGEPAEVPSAAPGLAQRLEETRLSKKMVLELDPALQQELRFSAPLPLPDSFAVLGVLFGTEQEPGFYLQSFQSLSGANLLARFSPADAQLLECVQQHLRAEETLYPSNVVLAEIAHLPEGRVGNVVCRPSFGRYEIPFLATAGVEAERQIPLSDLAISLRDSRIVLRSQRLGREVMPRLTSAHNFTGPRSLKLYKFLCLLSHQEVASELAWNWGSLDQSAFLPRVTLGNIVLSPARWRLTEETARELCQGSGDERLRRVEQWRQDNANQVPRFAFISEFDHQLLIDFENSLGVETFLEHVRKQPETILAEMFPAPGALPVRGPEGSFVHEIIVPFVRRKARQEVRRVTQAGARGTVPVPAERAAIGLADRAMMESGWLYAKLYCSPSYADRLLLELVQRLVEELREGRHVAGWFFTRYADPHWHLRVRLHGDPATLRERGLPLLLDRAAPFERQGGLWRLELDRYEREVERYGGPSSIGVAETLFQIDSELALELLPLTCGDDGADLRWKLAFAGMDRLLSGLGFGLEEKKSLAENMRDFREQAYLADETYRRQMAKKFRSDEVRETLAAIVTDDASAGRVLPEKAIAAFTRFSGRLAAVRSQLEDLQRANQLTETVPELAASFVHIHLNRMLRAAHLEQETVLSDFLARTYGSRLARELRS